MIATALGIGILTLAGLWLFGGLLARAGGCLLMLTGAVGAAAIGTASGLVLFALGIALWLVGHWHYALRHGEFKSLLAKRALSRN